jgi:hypothetical protein
MTSRFFLAAAVAAVVSTTACGESTRIRAQNEVFSDTVIAWAINGTPPELPSALSVAEGVVKRAEGDLSFELAFDLDEQGHVVLIPVRLVGVPSIAPGRVGFQLSTAPFEQVERAPSAGYQHDSLFVAPIGETVIVESESRVCITSLSPRLYSKLVVDSVRAVPREIYFRFTVDPNCGFRSLIPGTIPRS